MSEWIEAGGTREALDALIAQAPDQARQQPQPQPQEGDGGLEDRIALDFSALHVDRLRYVAVWNKWLQWNGAHWAFEDTLHAFHLARELCRHAEDARHKTVAAVVGLARTDRRQAATTAQWDADPWLLGTPGGTVDLRTGELMPAPHERLHHQDHERHASERAAGAMLSALAGISRTRDSAGQGTPRLPATHLRLLPHRADDRGLAVFPVWLRCKRQERLPAHRVRCGCRLSQNGSQWRCSRSRTSERHPTDLAMLRGARLVTAIETEEGKRWDESKLKALTGGDPIAARFMRQDFFEYTPQFKLLIAGNHKPSFRNVDEAIRRRVKLVPFTVTIPEAERDQELSAKLKAEWPGILRWMIEGCLMWQRDGLKPPAVVTNATDSYLTGQDDLQQFIDDACVVGANEFDSSEHLWDGWTDWAEDHHEFVGTQRRFGDRLEDKGYKRDREGIARTRIHRGIRCIRENAKKMAAELRRRADEARARSEAKARSADRAAGNAGNMEMSRSEKLRKNNGDGRNGHMPPLSTHWSLGDGLHARAHCGPIWGHCVRSVRLRLTRPV